MNSFLDALGYVGSALDKPGRAVRGLLGGRPQEALAALPFSDSLGLTDPEQAISGRNLLEQWGAVQPKGEDEGFDLGDLAGLGVQIGTDPLTYLGGTAAGWLGKKLLRNSVDAANLSRRIAELSAPEAKSASPLAHAGGIASIAEDAGTALAKAASPSPGISGMSGISGMAPASQPSLPTALPAPTPPFYSRLQRALEESDANQFKTQGFVDRLLKGKIGGQGNINPEEIETLGLKEALQGKDVVRKQDLLDAIKPNIPQVETSTLGGREREQLTELLNQKDQEASKLFYGSQRGGSLEPVKAINEEIKGIQDRLAQLRDPRWGGITTPGGKNYQETLLKLPPGKGVAEKKALEDLYQQKAEQLNKLFDAAPGEKLDYQQIDPLRSEMRSLRSKIDLMPEDEQGFQSSHWDDPNVLAHLRTNERVLPSGEKALHAEEFQSDWHQQGKQSGYGSGGKPSSFEAIAPNGALVGSGATAEEARAEAVHGLRRAGLSEDLPVTTQPVFATVPDAPFKENWHDLAAKQLLKEAVDKNLDTVTWNRGSDVQKMTGGKLEGQQQFYDQKMTKAFNKLGQKHGAKVGEAAIETNKLPSFEEWFAEQMDPEAKMTDLSWKEALAKETAEKGNFWQKYQKLQQDNSRSVHSFQVPQSLKKEIAMKGQPLWALMAALGLGGAAQQAQE